MYFIQVYCATHQNHTTEDFNIYLCLFVVGWSFCHNVVLSCCFVMFPCCFVIFYVPPEGTGLKMSTWQKLGTSVSLFVFVSVTVTVSVTWLCWSLAHAEQLLFSCVNSKAFHMSHVICEMLMLILGTCWTTFVFMCKLKSEYLYYIISYLYHL